MTRYLKPGDAFNLESQVLALWRRLWVNGMISFLAIWNTYRWKIVHYLATKVFVRKLLHFESKLPKSHNIDPRLQNSACLWRSNSTTCIIFTILTYLKYLFMTRHYLYVRSAGCNNYFQMRFVNNCGRCSYLCSSRKCIYVCGIVSACHRGDLSHESWDRIPPGYRVVDFLKEKKCIALMPSTKIR
jgi:hypothetical protein